MKSCCLRIFGMMALAFAATPAMASRGDAFGPLENKADQFRYIWSDGYGWGKQPASPYYSETVRLGVNMHVVLPGNPYYDFEKDRPKTDSPASQAARNTFMDICQKDGVGLVWLPNFPRDPWLLKNYARVLPGGKTGPVRNLDAANAKVQEMTKRASEEVGRRFAHHPAVLGFQNATEVRDWCHPTFSSEMRAAYRAHSGHDVPPEILTCGASKIYRNGPHWKALKDFPKDNIIDDDYPFLDFYVWSWQKGDGWCDWLTIVADTTVKASGRKLFSMYDPALRTPPCWGTGGDVTFLHQWTYGFPEPYKISYNISEMNSRARKANQGVLIMFQCIVGRSDVAPKGEHPENEPSWTKKYPNATYLTTPPDMVRESMWSAFTRKVDGVGFFGLNALYDYYDVVPIDQFHPTNTGYRCTNPLTREVIADVNRKVGIPLGPLFRALPERAPKVALVESYASMILGQRITWDCSGRWPDYGNAAVAANLMPVCLIEDEIRDYGIPDSVETLVMVDCDVLTRKCYEKIAAFVARGGRIVAAGPLCPALKADATLPAICQAFPPTIDDHDRGVASPKIGAEKREDSVRTCAAALKAAVGPKAAPYADSDKPDILVSARTYKTSDYVFAINDRRAYGDYVGQWKRIKEKGLPNAGTVVVNRAAGAVYDLVENKTVPFSVKGGKTFIDVSYQTNDGRLFLLTERPLGGLKFKVEDKTVTVTSSDRDVLIPIRVDGVGQKPFYAVVKDGVWSRSFENLTGSVVVTSLADGKTARPARSWWPF